MSSGGKGSGSAAAKTYNYYGSIAARVRCGRTDTLHAILLDKKIIWSGPLNRVDSTNPAVITIAGRGTVRYYWGLDNQYTVDPILIAAGNDMAHDHPAYTGQSYIVFDNFLFGQERNFANRVQVEATAIPQQTLITGTAAALDADDQANPFAAIAELATNERFGQGLPASMFAASSWQAAANAALAKSGLTYISMSIGQQQSLKAAAQDALVLCDGWLRAQLSTGACEAGVFTPPEEIDVSSLPVIDSTAIASGENPSWDPQTWRDVKTSWVTIYTDKDKNYKSRPSDRYDDPRALAARSLRDVETLQRPWICRRNQASQHSQRYGRRFSVPGCPGSIPIRRVLADSLRPGQHIRLDIDPEPGGAQLQQVCRLLSITRPQTGSVTIDVEIEPTLQPIAYTPAPAGPVTPPTPEVPDVAYARFFEVPTGLLDGRNFGVGILASRPDPLVIDFIAYYDRNIAGSFPAIGDGRSYGLRGRFAAAYTTASTGPFVVDLLDSLNREVIADDPGDAAARDDQLLMIALKIAGSGQIQADGSNKAWIEIFSCETFTPSGTNQTSVVALRARKGTPARDFALHDEVWFIRKSNLSLLEHADFADLAATSDIAYFKLQPGNQSEQRPLEDCALRQFSFALNRDTPSSTVGTYVETRYKRSGTVPSTPSGDVPSGWSLNTPSGSFAIWASYATKLTTTGALVGSWSTPVRVSGTIFFFQDTAPSGVDLLPGDTWFKTNSENAQYNWDGSAWVASKAVSAISVSSVAAGAILAGTVSVALQLDAVSITAGQIATGAKRFNTATPLKLMPFVGYAYADLISEKGSPIAPADVTTGGTAFTSTNLHFIGWNSGADGYNVRRFGLPSTFFQVTMQGNGNLPTGRMGYDIAYRINGGGWTVFTGHNVLGGTSFGNISMGTGVLITGLSGTDTIDFGAIVDHDATASGPGIGGLFISVACLNG
jgi:hypothetical protein